MELHPFYLLQSFMERGGPVLWIIAVVIAAMWIMVFERLWFYKLSLPKILNEVGNAWQGRTDQHSWCAHRIRDALHNQISLQIQRYIPLLSALVALCPLLGLMGTVTGMIEVFSVMSLTGGGDARGMASGVGRATIPAMAGMVGALAGFAARTVLLSAAQKQQERLDHQLTLSN